MKRLLLAITVAALAYSGWWAYAAQSLRSDVEDWFADQRAAGWEATYSDIAVRGFPNRTDLTLTDPVLRAPDGSIGWQAPFFQILTLTYTPGHVIVAWPDSQTITTAEGRFDVTSDGLRASVISEKGRILRSNIEATVLNIAGPDQAVAMAGLNAALQRIEPSTTDYRLALSIDSLARSNPRITGVRVPDSFGTLRTDLTLGLEAPLTLDTISAPPNPTALTLRTAEAGYGALVLKITGDTRFDGEGLATGEVTIEARNWRESVAAARAAGDLPPALSDGLTELLTLIASLSGSRDTLDVTLGLDAGTVRLGPLPIGQLPPLRWR